MQALEVEFQNQQMYVDAQILEIVGEPHIVSAIVAAPSCFTYTCASEATATWRFTNFVLYCIVLYSRFLVNWKNAGIHV